MSPTMELAVGKDLFALCGKCGPEWHVIVAMEGRKITKVQCKLCTGYHRYRNPPGEVNVNKVAEAKPQRTATIASRRAAKSTKTKTKVAGAGRPSIAPDMNRPVRSYAVSETYVAGDRIEHPKFGEGIVEGTPSPGKIDVFFTQGRRTLVHGRESSASA